MPPFRVDKLLLKGMTFLGLIYPFLPLFPRVLKTSGGCLSLGQV
jgi:hypothetical protein